MNGVIQIYSLLRLFMQSDAFGSDAEVQAKKKILKLTKKLQQPGVPPEKKARLLNKLEGSLAKLDSLPGLQTSGHPAGKLLELILSYHWNGPRFPIYALPC